MKNIDKQKLIISILGILIVGGYFVFSYVHIIRQKYVVQKRMDAQDIAIENICSKGVSIPELKKQRDELTDKLKCFSDKVPQGRNFARLWQQVADVMNECQLTDQLVQPGTELKSEALCSIPLSIECKGSLEQIFSFFQSLENFDRLIQIEEVQLENNTDYNAIVTLSAKANVYYQPDNKNNG